MKKLIGIVLALIMVVAFTACDNAQPQPSAPASSAPASSAPASSVPASSAPASSAPASSAPAEQGEFKVGLECGYAPYNWTQTDDSNGAVSIQGTSEFAGGYDIEIAKLIA